MALAAGNPNFSGGSISATQWLVTSPRRDWGGSIPGRSEIRRCAPTGRRPAVCLCQASTLPCSSLGQSPFLPPFPLRHPRRPSAFNLTPTRLGRMCCRRQSRPTARQTHHIFASVISIALSPFRQYGILRCNHDLWTPRNVVALYPPRHPAPRRAHLACRVLFRCELHILEVRLCSHPHPLRTASPSKGAFAGPNLVMISLFQYTTEAQIHVLLESISALSLKNVT